MGRRWIGIALVVAILAAIAWAASFPWRPLGFGAEAREFDIAPGASLRTVARELERAGILAEPWRFEALGRLTGRSSVVQAGSYLVDPGWSALELLDALSGSAALRLDRIALVEGWTFRQVREALNAHPGLRHDTAALSDADITAALGLSKPSPEGMLFPDTYHFAKGSSDLAVLRRAAARMQTLLAESWSQRDTTLPLSDPYDALILASLVEKETGRDADRALVAAVLVNRLRKGMRLQTDPAVIYGMGSSFDGNLRRRDLETDTPYNTYTRAGLPPTPIAMPGQASLAAATRPAPSPALYFVARGDGSSEFSESLGEHNRAVNKYQRQPSNGR